MGSKRKSPYERLTKLERVAIERGLDSKMSTRAIADALERSPSTVTAEVKRGRCLSRDKERGSASPRFPDMPVRGS